MADAGGSAEQFVNDLVWAVNTPSFVTGAEVVSPASVSAADVDGEELASFLELREVRRVGRYFEALILFWLERVRRVEVVAHSVQIRDFQRTLGELDFLFVDESGDLVHCEVSCKFYLHHSDRSGSHFPGPNSADNFENKAGRLFNHQLEMSRDRFPDVRRREALVRGCMFTHPSIAVPPVRPVRMAEDCLHGSWFRANEAALLADRWGDASMRIANKPFWLSPMLHAPVMTAVETVAAVRNHFDSSDRTLMIAATDADGRAEQLCVVPTHWDR